MEISRLVVCIALVGIAAALPPLRVQQDVNNPQWNNQLGGRAGVSRLRGVGIPGVGSSLGGSVQQQTRKQEALVQLLINVQQRSKLAEVQEIAQKWDIGQEASRYANTRVVKRFLDLWKQGTLSRDQLFNIYDDVQLDEAIALFDLLYFANDFDTLYKTAAWARQNINQGQFAYALTVAIIHRQDTQGLQLPPLYEILPNLFLDSMDIQKFTSAKMQGIQKYVALVNNSGLADITNQEQILSYFTEDIGLNNYNAYAQLYNPFWMNSEKYGLTIQNRGENYYYVNRQILALYNLNRISNGLPELEPLDCAERVIQPGYNPQLRYSSGQEVPPRPDNALLTSTAAITIDDIQAIELRIKDAIDSGYVISKDGAKISITSQLKGINILGNIIEGNGDSVNSRYYGAYTNMIRSLVALIMDPEQKHGVAPGPLANPAIQLRDPAFYIVQQRIQGLLERYKNNLPAYTVSQLAFPGVSIKDIVVDQLVTYFDLFDVDVSNVVNVAQPQEWDQLNYVAKTVRLNHKPFTIKVNILSEKKANAVLRIFLGPKQDELHTNFYGDSNVGTHGHPTYDLDRLRKYYVELDRVPIKLNAGVNVIERPSRELTATVGDVKPLRQLLRQSKQGQQSESGYLDPLCGIPDRLILPLGSESGLPLTLLAVVTPAGTNNVDLTDAQSIPYEPVIRQYSWDDDVSGEYQKVIPQPSILTRQMSCTGLSTLVDQRPLGFPLDRPIQSINQFYTPNMLFKDVIVQHINTTQINGNRINAPIVIQGLNDQL